MSAHRRNLFSVLLFVFGISFPAIAANGGAEAYLTLSPSDLRDHSFGLTAGVGEENWHISGTAIFASSQYSAGSSSNAYLAGNSSTDLGEYTVADTYGADFAYILSVSESLPRVSLSGGLYWGVRGDVLSYGTSGKYFVQDKKNVITPAAGIGLLYPLFNTLLIGADFHSVRGLGVTLGFIF